MKVQHASATLIENLAQPFQFLRVDSFLFQYVQHQQLAGILEKPAQQMLNLGALGLVLIQHRAIDVRPPVFHMPHAPFFLEDANNSQHRVVGQRFFAGRASRTCWTVAGPFSQSTCMMRSSASVRVADCVRGKTSSKDQSQKSDAGTSKRSTKYLVAETRHGVAIGVNY